MTRALFALSAIALMAGCTGAPSTAPSPSPAATPAALASPPPWPAPTDASARITAAGLEPMPSESLQVHYHSHLSVFYNGQSIEVPANVGIDTAAGRISALHTHAATGVMHVESPKEQTITLGQFFTEWGVPLAGAKVYVNGAEVADGPGVALADHQEIAVVYGTPPDKIPDAHLGSWF